ncbi:MAG: ornithine carbamoyltransferase, partial [Clostridiales Family XIII bacterium]|nr:ornithine carbamoyltransferase [Clostridiales Family XIII bacterium]
MLVNLKGRSLLTLMDFAPEEIRYLLDLAKELKARKRAGMPGNELRGKNILLLFEKSSTRTRCAFETGAMQEGAGVTFLDKNSSQFGKKESLEDSARVFGRFYDGIEYRGYDQAVAEALAEYSGVPVWNGLTDTDHPTQILADLMTIEEHANKPLNEIKTVFCGDTRNNMACAWMYGCAKMGMKFAAYGPEALAPDAAVLKRARDVAAETGAEIAFSSDANILRGADVVCTDVWASMGEEALIPERTKLLAPFKVTSEL